MTKSKCAGKTSEFAENGPAALRTEIIFLTDSTVPLHFQFPPIRAFCIQPKSSELNNYASIIDVKIAIELPQFSWTFSRVYLLDDNEQFVVAITEEMHWWLSTDCSTCSILRC